MSFEIKWQKWKDPFAAILKDKDEDEDEFPTYKDSYERAEKHTINGPVLIGPFGAIPINEENLPSKLFNFWRVDTSFKITKTMVKKMNYIDGVETLDIYTPYRFRIGIAQLFDEKAVQKEVDKTLRKIQEKRVNYSRSEEYKKLLDSQYKFWAIGSIEGKDYFFGNSTKEGVLQYMEEFRKKGNEITNIEYCKNMENKEMNETTKQNN